MQGTDNNKKCTTIFFFFILFEAIEIRMSWQKRNYGLDMLFTEFFSYLSYLEVLQQQ